MKRDEESVHYKSWGNRLCALLLGLSMLVPGWLHAQERASDTVRELYVINCSMCHGVDGNPKPIAKGAPNFTDPKWVRTVEEIEKVITNGKGRLMLGFSKKLSPAQIRDLAEFVFALKKGTP